MNYVDLFLAVIFVIAGIQGFYRGFILELFSVLAFFFGIFGAIRYSEPIALWIIGDSEWLWLLRIVVFVGLFVGLTFLIKRIAGLLKQTVQLAFLGWMDNLLGVVMGVFKWAFLLSVMIWMLMTAGLQLPLDDLSNSLIFPHIAHLAPNLVQSMQGIFPFLDGILDWGRDLDVQKRFV